MLHQLWNYDFEMLKIRGIMGVTSFRAKTRRPQMIDQSPLPPTVQFCRLDGNIVRVSGKQLIQFLLSN